jgi:hypothetical protein
MPKLHTINGSVWEWGDMILLPGGAIFSIDADGYFVLSFGKPVKVNRNIPPNLNDDGSTNKCVQIAMAHLGLPVPTDQVSHERLNELLKGLEPIEWESTVADFINTHGTGSYFISSYNGHGTHAFALVDGTAFNITCQTLSRHIRRAWRLRKDYEHAS